MTLRTKIIIFVTTVVVFYVADQWTKMWIVDNIELYARDTVIYNWFDLVHYRNTGIAFGLFRGGDPAVKIPFFIGLAIVAMGFLVYMLIKEPLGKFGPVLLGLIGSGAIGNITDRVRLGSVVDFLRFYHNAWEWPAFNVADMCICVGATMLALISIFPRKFLTEDELDELRGVQADNYNEESSEVS